MIDLLIEDALVFNSFVRKFEKMNVAVKGERFYYISAEDLHFLEPQKRISANGKYLVPGLIDIHMHIESSMVPPQTFSPAALACGVTTVVADAHEIANVFGLEGVEAFLAAETELDIFYAIPSSVPSTTPELETTGGLIGVAEVDRLLEHPRVIALGEAMNFKGITAEPDSLIRQILRQVQNKRPFMPLEGHIPRISGLDLAKFMYAGITADHTHQSPDSILEKIKAGIFVELQKKSLTAENMAVINEHRLYEHAALITDDVMADDLLRGHLDENLRLAIRAGLPAAEAVYMSTYTPARRMGLQDRGAIAAGHLADFLLLDELASFSIQAVYKRGRLVYQPEKIRPVPMTRPVFPAPFYRSVQARPLSEKDLQIAVAGRQDTVRCNVMAIQKTGTFTELVERDLTVKDGYLDWENSGLSLIVVQERYGKSGNLSLALVENTLKEKGAVGTTWAHDHHNLMVMGNSAGDILTAQQTLLEMQGGYVVSRQQEIRAACPLPVGGILSDAPLETVGTQLRQVRAAMRELGYENSNEIMSFSTLSLPVSPQVKITDVGMLDVHSQQLIPLIAEVEHADAD